MNFAASFLAIAFATAAPQLTPQQQNELVQCMQHDIDQRREARRHESAGSAFDALGAAILDMNASWDDCARKMGIEPEPSPVQPVRFRPL